MKTEVKFQFLVITDRNFVKFKILELVPLVLSLLFNASLNILVDYGLFRGLIMSFRLINSTLQSTVAFLDWTFITLMCIILFFPPNQIFTFKKSDGLRNFSFHYSKSHLKKNQ